MALENLTNGTSQEEVLTGQENNSENPVQAPQTDFTIDSFNNHFETSFENEASLKEALGARSRLQQIELELNEAREKASKYDQVLEYYKPENLYGDEETYAFIELKKKFPDRDPGVVSKIRSSDFNSMSDLDKLVLADKLEVKGNVSDAVRKQGILHRLGIESTDTSEWEELDHYKLASALSSALPKLNEIKNFKPEAKAFDLATEKEAFERQRADRKKSLQEKISPFADSLLKNYEGPKAYSKNQDGQFNQIFDYVVDADMKSQFREQLIQVMVDADLEPNKENLTKAMEYMDNHFKIMNFDKIVSAAIKKGQLLASEKAHGEIHNDTPVNTKEAPKVNEEQGLTLKERFKRSWSQQKK